MGWGREAVGAWEVEASLREEQRKAFDRWRIARPDIRKASAST